MLHKWKIFYKDSTYSDADGVPEFAPKRGVQSIIVADESLVNQLVKGEDKDIPVNDDFYELEMLIILAVM